MRLILAGIFGVVASSSWVATVAFSPCTARHESRRKGAFRTSDHISSLKKKPHAPPRQQQQQQVLLQLAMKKIVTGANGKPAKSDQEDLDLTRQVILDFMDNNDNMSFHEEEDGTEIQTSVPKKLVSSIKEKTRSTRTFIKQELGEKVKKKVGPHSVENATATSTSTTTTTTSPVVLERIKPPIVNSTKTTAWKTKVTSKVMVGGQFLSNVTTDKLKPLAQHTRQAVSNRAKQMGSMLRKKAKSNESKSNDSTDSVLEKAKDEIIVHSAIDDTQRKKRSIPSSLENGKKTILESLGKLPSLAKTMGTRLESKIGKVRPFVSKRMNSFREKLKKQKGKNDANN